MSHASVLGRSRKKASGTYVRPVRKLTLRPTWVEACLHHCQSFGAYSGEPASRLRMVRKYVSTRALAHYLTRLSAWRDVDNTGRMSQ